MSQIEHFRSQKDEFFATNPQSPLTHEQRDEFDGLKYFPEEPKLRFELSIQELDTKEKVQIITSTGDLREYERYGKVHFSVDGEDTELTVYSTEHGFFLPFVDSQAGIETYGAGRYLDPEILPNGKLELDFNLAYNPYCAYNEMYSCPLPPAENRLSVAIKAGEKNFK
jgi:uncharacterized protein (DUF1684 family)